MSYGSYNIRSAFHALARRVGANGAIFMEILTRTSTGNPKHLTPTLRLPIHHNHSLDGRAGSKTKPPCFQTAQSAKQDLTKSRTVVTPCFMASGEPSAARPATRANCRKCGRLLSTGTAPKLSEKRQKDASTADDSAARPRAMRCGKCKDALYCGAACQRADWGRHKPQCRPRSANQRRADALERAYLEQWGEGALRAATDTLRRLVLLRRSMGDAAGERRALVELGTCLESQGDVDEALVSLARGASMAGGEGGSGGGDVLMQAKAAGVMGLCYSRKGDDERALAAHEADVALHREDGSDKVGLSRALNNLGLVLLKMGMLGRAVACHAEDYTLAREARNVAGQTTALCNLGNARLVAGDLHGALDCLDTALGLAKEGNDLAGRVRAELLLGQTMLQLGEPERAAEHCNRYLRAARKSKSVTGIRKGLQLLCVSQAKLGKFENAVDSLFELSHLDHAGVPATNDDSGAAIEFWARCCTGHSPESAVTSLDMAMREKCEDDIRTAFRAMEEVAGGSAARVRTWSGRAFSQLAVAESLMRQVEADNKERIVTLALDVLSTSDVAACGTTERLMRELCCCHAAGLLSRLHGSTADSAGLQLGAVFADRHCAISSALAVGSLPLRKSVYSYCSATVGAEDVARLSDTALSLARPGAATLFMIHCIHDDVAGIGVWWAVIPSCDDCNVVDWKFAVSSVPKDSLSINQLRDECLQLAVSSPGSNEAAAALFSAILEPSLRCAALTLEIPLEVVIVPSESTRGIPWAYLLAQERPDLWGHLQSVRVLPSIAAISSGVAESSELSDSPICTVSGVGSRGAFNNCATEECDLAATVLGKSGSPVVASNAKGVAAMLSGSATLASILLAVVPASSGPMRMIPTVPPLTRPLDAIDMTAATIASPTVARAPEIVLLSRAAQLPEDRAKRAYRSQLDAVEISLVVKSTNAVASNMWSLFDAARAIVSAHVQVALAEADGERMLDRLVVAAQKFIASASVAEVIDFCRTHFPDPEGICSQIRSLAELRGCGGTDLVFAPPAFWASWRCFGACHGVVL